MSPRTCKTVPIIEPIVPVAGSPPLHDPQWIYEPKFDGFRGMLYVSAGECYIRSKRGKVLSRFADLALRVGAELHARNAILDGEVVGWMMRAGWTSGPSSPAEAGCTMPPSTCYG